MRKAMLSFMACVVIRDSMKFLERPTPLKKIYDEAPVNWNAALDHIALIAKENGCKYAIAKCTCRKAK